MQQSLAIGWFPNDEWTAAVERWPELVDEMPREHAAYRAAIQARLKDLNARAIGTKLIVVPLSIAALEEQAAASELDIATAELRGRTASRLAQQGGGVVWPPARNEVCWCNSGAKYKNCCGATARSTAAP